MGFKALGNNFKNLFTASRVYKIPDYQRDFSWDKENYRVFLKDIISQLSVEENDYDSLVFKTNSYYMGNMIFLGSDSGDQVDVIDGQQRLTVATILFAVLRDLFIEMSTTVSVSKDYSDTIQTDYLVKKVDGKLVRKLQTTSSYPYFTKAIQDASSQNVDAAITPEESDLKACYDDLKKLLSYRSIKNNFPQYFNKNNPLDNEKYVDFLKAIRDQLLASEVVEIFVDRQDQAYKIFESINSKGKPLSQVDIIKNDIFSNLVSDTSLTNDGPETWQKILDVVSANNGSINEFFLNYWKAVYPEDSVSGKSLYKKYLDRFGNISDRQTFIDLLNDLLHSSKIYYRVTQPHKDDFLRQEKKPQYIGLTAINKLRIAQIKSLLLTLYTKNETMHLNNTRLNTNILKIANYQFAFFGISSGVRSNKFTGPYKQASVKINNAESQTDVFAALDELISSFAEQLTRKSFIDSFGYLTFQKSASRSGLSNFPASHAIHQLSSLMNNDHELNDDSITLEHIIDEKYKDDAVNKIGNISVLERNIHDEINKNNIDTFEQKKPYYSKSSSVMIHHLLDSYPDFTLDDIDARSKYLGEYFFDHFLS